MMILGSGLIANAYIKSGFQHPSLLIFASGVSNSAETDHSAFNRELELLKKYADKDRTIVYFSTVSIYDPTQQESLYIQHKNNMERWLERETDSFIIFRLPNVVGHSPNVHTLFNFLVERIRSGTPFDVYANACRNLLDIEDLFTITLPFLRHSGPRLHINVAGSSSIRVPELVHKIEQRMNRKGHYTLLNKGACYDIPAADLPLVYVSRENYIDTIIEKYITP